eukprot:CAMPEP_0182500556 /NCGR_PEP_ID=MMETSP1321-20130603/9528_1 /TAXON_ID=91990 /ORGANISM="Bolidomonas sp., Strain RCC1657" /LENGTH=81 /DNA_ID=CAMNT_0024705027 /DNA_START=122 /DNA_END=367 /DNA_ORIENTATION=+
MTRRRIHTRVKVPLARLLPAPDRHEEPLASEEVVEVEVVHAVHAVVASHEEHAGFGGGGGGGFPERVEVDHAPTGAAPDAG